jgi:hypothetical protein
MPNPCSFADLQAILRRRIPQLPDERHGPNTRYAIQDAFLGAFGVCLR